MAAMAPKSDLLVRTASAVVMLGVAGTALWWGGDVFTFFVALVAFLVVLEWRNIVVRFPDGEFAKGVWMAIGGVYAAFGCVAVLLLHDKALFTPVLAAVIGTDIGAYFAGRTIGGPKIAPAISPSKTWAGLGGGMVAAAAALIGMVALIRAQFGGWGAANNWFWSDHMFGVSNVVILSVLGAAMAVVAQAGDFFESWMKRRAGVKDSGNILPGHGGMFDRVDGMLAAAIFAFLLQRAFLP